MYICNKNIIINTNIDCMNSSQVVCNAKLKIMDIVAHWRGSTHDARIFRESSIKQRFEDGHFNGRLLGDGGYACTPYLFTPVRNPRIPEEVAYNKAQMSTRNTVERCFGVWKQRFRCLLRGMAGSLSTIKTTVVALAVLQCLAIDMNDPHLGKKTISCAPVLLAVPTNPCTRPAGE